MEKNISRRNVIKGAVAGIAVSALPLSMEGCNATQWIQTALNDLPLVLQIVTNILQIIAAAGGVVTASVQTAVNTIGTDAKNALMTAQQAVTDYENNAANKTTLLGKLDAALVTAQNDFSQMLAAFQINDPGLESTIAAVLGSAVTIIVALQTIIPPAPAPNPVVGAVRGTPKPRTDSEAIKTAYNVLLGGRYPNYQLR